MKKVIILFIFNIICLLVIAQSNIRLNDYWDNTYYINPASIDEEYMTVFSVAARKQWYQFPGAPNTLFASGTLFLDKLNTQFGLKTFVDKIGYTSTSNVSLSYAYVMTVNRRWRLQMGLAVNYQNLSYDMSKVNMYDLTDPTVFNNLARQNNYNADLGAELVMQSLKIGVSGQNIFSMFTDKTEQQVNTNYLYAKYRDKTPSFINWGYGLCGIQTGSLLQLELNTTAYFKFAPDANDLFQAGLFYRTRSEMGTILGISLSEAIQLYYSYDYNVSGISRRSVGTHELMLVLKLNKNSECIPCRYR